MRPSRQSQNEMKQEASFHGTLKIVPHEARDGETHVDGETSLLRLASAMQRLHLVSGHFRH